MKLVFESKKRMKKINEDVGNMSLLQILNTKVAYSESQVRNFGAPVGVNPDLSFLDIDSAVYFNAIEIEDIAESLGDELAKKIILDCFKFVSKTWFTVDGIYYYKSEEDFEHFSEE